MIPVDRFFSVLEDLGFDFFTGVPDSLLKDLCAYITDQVDRRHHIIAVNEGNALGIAAGYHLSTGRIPVVYLQNSGLGNLVNPLTSLADKEVYSIPMLLIIGWRGEPGVHDEPQHVKMGRCQNALLEALEIPYEVLPTDMDEALMVLEQVGERMMTSNEPFAILVRKSTFEPYEMKMSEVRSESLELGFQREDVVRELLPFVGDSDVVVSTTGKLSRELYELRERLGQTHERDFLTVGSMGHASSIALGIALSRPERKVWCFDGDGSLLMHMGSLGVIGQTVPENLIHIVINNFAHDSVGGQPTAGSTVDFVGVAKACGYALVERCSSLSELPLSVGRMHDAAGPVFLEIPCEKGARKDLGRPLTSPAQNKEAFMRFLGKQPYRGLSGTQSRKSKRSETEHEKPFML